MFAWLSLPKHRWTNQQPVNRNGRAGPKRRLRSWRPLLEELEQRLVPTAYYVNSYGMDSYDGSCAHPWQHISQVMNHDLSPGFYAGDSISFGANQTFSDGTLSLSSQGDPNNPILITSYVACFGPRGPLDPSNRATITPPPGSSGIAITGQGYQVSNINVTGSDPGNTHNNEGIVLKNPSANMTYRHFYVDHVDVSGFGKYGIHVIAQTMSSYIDDVSMTYAKVFNNITGGLFLENTESAVQTLTHVYIGHVQAFSNPGWRGTGAPGQGTGQGITLFNAASCGGTSCATIERLLANENGSVGTGASGIWTANSDHVIVQFNESYYNHDIYDPVTGGGVDGHGFNFDNTTTNSVMQYNYAHNNDGYGYVLTAPPSKTNNGNTIRYNVGEDNVRGTRQAGMNHYASIGVNGSVTGGEIYNNTLYQSPFTVGTTTYYPPVLGVDSGFFASGQRVHFRNNILDAKGDANNTPAFVDVGPPNGQTGGADLLFQGNDYFSTTGVFNIFWKSATVNITSLIQWRANPGPNQEHDDLGQQVGTTDNPALSNAGGGSTIGNADQLGLSGTLTAYKFTANTPMTVTNGGVNIWRMSQHTIDPGPRDWWGDSMPTLSDTALYSIGAFQKTQ